jgi:hypothetical protein
VKTVLNFCIVADLLCTASTAHASTVYFFDGACDQNSCIKVGSADLDFSNIKGAPIVCDAAVLVELSNGRELMQFTNKRGKNIGPLGFAGVGIDRHTNPKLALFPIDRIYPRQRLGPTPEETYSQGMNGTPINGAEGFCVFDKHSIDKSKSLSCVSKIEKNGTKTIFKVIFNVTKGSVIRNMSDDFSFPAQ